MDKSGLAGYVRRLRSNGVSNVEIVKQLIDELSKCLSARSVLLIDEDNDGSLSSVLIGTENASELMADLLDEQEVDFTHLNKAEDFLPDHYH